MKKSIFLLLYILTIGCYAQSSGNDTNAKFQEELEAFAQEELESVYTAARNGNVIAQKNMGLMEIQMGNFERAMTWLTVAAKKGNADAQFNLAIMFRDGEGCKVDYTQAMFWFKKAQSNINPRIEAYGEIGKMYQYGFGVYKDISEAIHWYEQGAKLGDHYSMCYLGRIYSDSGDMNKALSMFKKAADAGNDECACKVYYILEDNDLQTALYYLKKSADAGYPDGMFWLGLRLFSGKDMPQNQKKGYDLIMNAAAKGSEFAAEFLSEFAK